MYPVSFTDGFKVERTAFFGSLQEIREFAYEIMESAMDFVISNKDADKPR